MECVGNILVAEIHGATHAQTGIMGKSVLLTPRLVTELMRVFPTR